MKRFADLSEQEVLALAISNEEEDCRIYLNIADRLHDKYPSSAKLFQEIAAEETGHHRGDERQDGNRNEYVRVHAIRSSSPWACSGPRR